MSFRNIGGYISAAYNALAANVGPGVQTNQTEGVFTLQTAMQAVAANQWCTDPYFDQTTLLLQADNAANASQNISFIDSGSSGATLTPTSANAPAQGMFTPFSQPDGYWSNYFSGSSQYMTLPSSANLAPGTVFTFEAWIYFDAIVSNEIIYSSTTTGQLLIGFNTTTSWGIGERAGAFLLTSTTLPISNQWNHIVISRGGTGTNQTSLFLNGVRVANGTVANAFNVTAAYQIGYDGGSPQWTGYISNIRLVQNGDIYGYTNTKITVPTSPLTTTVLSGTVQLLTCQSNRFIDNSANNFTLTKTGPPSVKLFFPFAPVKSYLDTSIGGSVQFNGSNNIQGSSSVIGTAGNFTFEYFGYFPTASPNTYVFVGSSSGPLITFNASFFPSYGRQGTILITGTTAFPTNEWAHYAVVRSSGISSLYVNGLFIGSATDTSDYSAAQTFGFGGGTGAASLLAGSIISNYRMVNSALYSGTSTTTPNFTIPTAPFTTATANTRVLFSATNGSVLDATVKNNLQTMGNAQVSTSVKKYGSGSMLFDGTGDYIYAASSTNFELGAGDFTVEFWMYPTTIAGSERGIFGIGTTDPNSNLIRIQQSTSKLQFWLGGSNSGGPGAGTKTGIITCTTTIAINTWYHVALVRSGSAANNVKLYLNGVVDGQGSATYNIGAYPFSLGMGYPGSAIELFIGNIDDFRITKGIARYTAAFTPPTIAFQRQ